MQMLETYSGFFTGAFFDYYLWGSVFTLLVIGFTGAPLIIWTLAATAMLVGFGVPIPIVVVFLAVAAIFNIPPVRTILISAPLMKIMKALQFIPTISETERTALDAGVVWIEKDLFSGKPDFKKIMQENYPKLTREEQDFIDGPVDRLCEMLDDWDVWTHRQLPKEAWDYLRKEKFLGMIIPKEYGGLEFSAMAHSEVIAKLSSRCIPAAITVMVPNSLGPGELLIHYGTDEQKKHYLPRLARGEEIPCFGLTEPTAGSDAGAIQAEGILFKGTDGKLYLRMNWNKRWITLAAISTVMGIAFRMKDPENILGKGEDIGITCGLVPTNTPGVAIGRRHDPLSVPFYNCPTQGKNVVVSVDTIVGGLGGAGKGWKMLMECLAAGRGISLPAQSVGGAKLTTRAVSAHATIRKQFGISIGKFEGIEEPLARIAGYTYLMEAMRRFTLGALDKGIKAPVITAIAKYNATELGRKVINDGMDIMGGSGISRGKRNLLAATYIASPIGITVEGANILTRTLIIFGQGALRAHPYAYAEVRAVEANDAKGFDRAFWGHIGHIVRNTFRSVILSWTRGALAPAPVWGSTARYYRKLAWVSASFAIMSDIAMGSLGGALKQREKITGRFADILSWMYIGTSILRRFQADGSKREDLPFVHFSMNVVFFEMQRAFDGIFANLRVPGLTWFFRGPVRWWSGLNTLADAFRDTHTHKIATLIMTDSEQRERFTEGIFMPKNIEEQLRRLDHSFKVAKRSEVAERKIRDAVKKGTLPKKKPAELITMAVEKGIINRDEQNDLINAEALRYQAIQVDDFSEEEFLGNQKPTMSATPETRERA